MQKRTIFSLLLTLSILAFAFATSMAQEVTFQSKSALRCNAGELSVTVNSPDDLSGLELVFDVADSSVNGAGFSSFSVDWAAGLDAADLPDRGIDINGTVVRMWAMQATGNCLAAGQTVVATISFVTNDVCSGEIFVDAAEAACEPPSTVVARTAFVECAGSALVTPTVNAGQVTIQNSDPSMDAIADQTLHWGQTLNLTATATDNDLAASPGGCESLTFSKVSGPGALIVSAGGNISWNTTGDDVCEHEVTVKVTDGCGGTDETTFTVCVQNDRPSITCSDDQFLGWGATASGTLSGDDPDGGPGALMFYEVSFDGPGDLVVNADGTWEWQTEFAPEYTGTFTACVAVKDAAPICDPCSPQNADTCCFTITVVPFLITIDKREDVIQGKIEPVSITMLDDTYVNQAIGGFDFLIEYDPTALIVNSVEPGQFILDCGWEYFTYRYGPAGNCGPNACPSGKLRIVAIAETNNGDNHPACFTNGPGISNELAKINFLVTNDRTFECQYVPIRFCWYDCGDNALSSKSGDTLFISRFVYDYSWGQDYPDWVDISASAEYPTLYGAQDVDCFGPDQNKVPYRLVDFRNGGIDIVCADSIDARGDVNLNEIPYEVADAVLFANYFVYGLSVFHTNTDGQIAATDVNADGIVLSVADLVYLIRVVVGDALPYPKTVVPASYVHTVDGVVSVSGDVEMGAAYVVAAGNVAPTLLADNMEMMYNYDGTNTRILVYSMQANSFSGNFLQVNGDLVSVEMATIDGATVTAKLLPTEFALFQNYPNPFNPTTEVSFNLPYTADYELSIYNVNGQLVKTFVGTGDAGTVNIEWNASNVASGVYLYRLVADGRQVATKKMVLLK